MRSTTKWRADNPAMDPHAKRSGWRGLIVRRLNGEWQRVYCHHLHYSTGAARTCSAHAARRFNRRLCLVPAGRGR